MFRLRFCSGREHTGVCILCSCPPPPPYKVTVAFLPSLILSLSRHQVLYSPGRGYVPCFVCVLHPMTLSCTDEKKVSGLVFYIHIFFPLLSNFVVGKSFIPHSFYSFEKRRQEMGPGSVTNLGGTVFLSFFSCKFQGPHADTKCTRTSTGKKRRL